MTRDEAVKAYGIYIRKEKEIIGNAVKMIEGHFGIKGSYIDTIALFPFGNQLVIFQLTKGDENSPHEHGGSKWMVTIHIAGRFIHYHEKDKVWFEDPIEAFKPAFIYSKKFLQDLAQEIPSV